MLKAQNNEYQEVTLDEKVLKKSLQFKDLTKDKLHRCKQCNKAFIKAYELKVHTRTHTGEKPYRCEQCNKSFRTGSSLKLHNRIHTDEYPYRCTYCNKGFPNPSRLVRHVRIHTGHKPYVCNQCGKTFSDNGGLKTHQWTHAREQGLFSEQLDIESHESFDVTPSANKTADSGTQVRIIIH